jgi:hypothetical protein
MTHIRASYVAAFVPLRRVGADPGELRSPWCTGPRRVIVRWVGVRRPVLPSDHDGQCDIGAAASTPIRPPPIRRRVVTAYALSR